MSTDTISEREANYSDPRITRIRELNDALRKHSLGGEIFVTRGVRDKGTAFQVAAMSAVRAFDEFTEGNDPYCEHDCGSVTIEGEGLNWKIDYYDQKLKHHSPDEADPAVTRRVLTILLAEEY